MPDVVVGGVESKNCVQLRPNLNISKSLHITNNNCIMQTYTRSIVHYAMEQYFSNCFQAQIVKTQRNSTQLKETLRGAIEVKNVPKSGKVQNQKGEGSALDIKKSTIQNVD